MTTASTNTLPAGSPADVAGRSYSKPAKVAARLGVHKNTVFRWLKGGLLSRHVIGGTTLIANDEVDRLMSQARVEKAGQAA